MEGGGDLDVAASSQASPACPQSATASDPDPAGRETNLDTNPTWHAAVTYLRRVSAPSGEQLAAMAAQLPGSDIPIDKGVNRIEARLTVRASTLHGAAELALVLARRVYASVMHEAPTIIALSVLTMDDYQRQRIRPDAQSLVGKSEIARALGVTPQRVDELARTHPDFPAPVTRLRMGSVYTSASIDAFVDSWVRRPGRPRKVAD